MKTITRTIYVASDGREFSDQTKCAQYEADGCVEFQPIPKYADHLPLDDRNFHFYVQGDGSGYYATAYKMSRVSLRSSNHPSWATHLVYFGK